MKNYRISSKQNGLTLIEILVAMVIGLFLLAGVMQIFLGSQQSYRLQENLSRMQENGRFAMDFITRDIRMAGAMGCVETVDIENKLNSGSVFDAFAEEVSGEEGGANNQSDEITINSMLPTDVFVIPPAGSLTPTEIKELQKDTLPVNSMTNLRNNDIVMVTNCDKGEIFKITDLTASSIGHTSELKGSYGGDAQIYKANFVTYSIADSVGVTSLFKSINGADRQALVENIENMQILYGEDTSGDNTPDHYVSADRVTDMKNVISIRVSLLAVSPANNLVSNITPYTYNGVEITPTDKRLRQVVSSTIAIRNRLP